MKMTGERMRKSSKLNSFAYYIFFPLGISSLVSLVVSIFCFVTLVLPRIFRILDDVRATVCACNSSTFLLLLGDAMNMCSKKVLHLLQRHINRMKKKKTKRIRVTGKKTPQKNERKLRNERMSKGEPITAVVSVFVSSFFLSVRRSVLNRKPTATE